MFQSYSGAPSVTPDDDVFQHLSLTYSKNNPRMYRGNSCKAGSPRFNNGITNGAAWYPLTGTYLNTIHYELKSFWNSVTTIAKSEPPSTNTTKLRKHHQTLAVKNSSVLYCKVSRTADWTSWMIPIENLVNPGPLSWKQYFVFRWYARLQLRLVRMYGGHSWNFLL